MKKVIPVSNKGELAKFIDFPHDLYKDDPYYVPELFIAQRDLLTKHPFHKHNQLQTFLAYDGDKIVGRIAAILNNTQKKKNKKPKQKKTKKNSYNEQLIEAQGYTKQVDLFARNRKKQKNDDN